MLQWKHQNNILSYVSLFSWAWIGCYWFKQEWFYCVSTVELLEKRLKIQKYNHKCIKEEYYICWDIKTEQVKQQLQDNINNFQKEYWKKDLDVIIATPPCQWMSVANHKKKDEKWRNSLVIESIKIIHTINPKFFVFENVPAFLKTLCTDIDGNDKPIWEAIENNLSWKYHIYGKVINFKNYWSNSSRTRTLVIWVRKDIHNITPIDLFPNQEREKTLYEVIGNFPSLTQMWEICSTDIYHQFRAYSPYMRDWIKDLKEWESAFDNEDLNKRPHQIKNGEFIANKRKNGDKYTRQIYNKVAPCIHTRNDILASQNTIHPKDDRVFSIRELMEMMTIPYDFSRSNISFQDLNNLSFEEKRKFLKNEEINIRQSIGEWVPTIIFHKIATNIKKQISSQKITFWVITDIIEEYNLMNIDNLKDFITKNPKNFPENVLLTIAEISNSNRVENAAYYTRQDIVFWIIKELPDFQNKKEINILEPSVWIWAFLPQIIKKYEDIEKVNIDIVDIDNNSLEILQILLSKQRIPTNIHLNIYNMDFFWLETTKEYDLVIWNPPYWKIKDKTVLKKYKFENKNTNNLFALFLEKALSVWKFISFIVPKSLLNSPEFWLTRTLIEQYSLTWIIDFWENAFLWVKIETINLFIQKKQNNTLIKIISYINKTIQYQKSNYIMDKTFPYRLIYRNSFFDNTAEHLSFNIFNVFRDRQITKKYTKSEWKIRILKSRNIASNHIINIPGYDCYIDDIENFSVKKFLNNTHCVLVPNLTYNPRACFLPKDTLTDGSVAILVPKDWIDISAKDLEYYSTTEFKEFYRIARNLGTRSLNIDSNSVFYFGKLK